MKNKILITTLAVAIIMILATVRKYVEGNVPKGFEVWTIPESLWAKFSSYGPLPAAAYNIKKYIWFEWLPVWQHYIISADGNLLNCFF